MMIKKFLLLISLFLCLVAPISLAGVEITISGVTSDSDVGACIGSDTLTITGTYSNMDGVNGSAGSVYPCDLVLYENASASPSGTGNIVIGRGTNTTSTINLSFIPENYMDSNKRYAMGWNCTNTTTAGPPHGGLNQSRFSSNATGITWDCYRIGDLPSIGTNLIGNFGMAVIVVMGLIILVVVATFVYKKFGLKPKNRRI